MSDIAFRQDLPKFAVELRKLAYTMPAGHEDPRGWLSEPQQKGSVMQVRTLSPAPGLVMAAKALGCSAPRQREPTATPSQHVVRQWRRSHQGGGTNLPVRN